MSHRFHYLRMSYQTKAKTEPVGCLITSVGENKNEVAYALSAAHPKDKFDKMMARKIASGRLNDGKPVVLSGDFSTGHSIMRAVMGDISSRKEEDRAGSVFKFPKKIRDAAKKWLEFANAKSNEVKCEKCGNCVHQSAKE
jgi:hypothetical protein